MAPNRPPTEGRTHTVVAGDSLWTIARSALATHLGEPPPNRALSAYWWQTVELNRPNLADPANPDLLFPGDVVQLPPFPETPAGG